MNNRIDPKVKQVLNVSMHVMHNFLWGGVVINTTAYHLGLYSLQLLLLRSSMVGCFGEPQVAKFQHLLAISAIDFLS